MGGTIHCYLPELNRPSRVLRGPVLPRYHLAMIDDDNAIEIAFEPPDADLTYAHYLETCRGAGVTPVSREQAQGLIQEWSEVLSGLRRPR
jgi:hypothetical protein